MTTGRIELGPNGRAVAANVKRLRTARGMSLRALSEALSEVGRGLSQDAINKIENGAKPDAKQVRRVDVDDLVALAVALRVNPSALLLPLTDDPAETIEVTGVGSVLADRAWDWVDGELPIEKIKPGDPGGAILRFQLDARPAGRRMQLGASESGDDDG
ncbi:helix-turn-helix transcriptional regulator [Streptomyces sp. NBC_00885]|uniref:helix-turn-helix domain-containing protein n=1 Tax=Streptomyces sp. NBC_00885 TaxID=2975857 RepID=UPI0038672418|nr:helix-turn-helix transcriptional regulator [Streptomyces sp. NBC_00885]